MRGHAASEPGRQDDEKTDSGDTSAADAGAAGTIISL